MELLTVESRYMMNVSEGKEVYQKQTKPKPATLLPSRWERAGGKGKYFSTEPLLKAISQVPTGMFPIRPVSHTCFLKLRLHSKSPSRFLHPTRLSLALIKMSTRSICHEDSDKEKSDAMRIQTSLLNNVIQDACSVKTTMKCITSILIHNMLLTSCYMQVM